MDVSRAWGKFVPPGVAAGGWDGLGSPESAALQLSHWLNQVSVRPRPANQRRNNKKADTHRTHSTRKALMCKRRGRSEARRKIEIEVAEMNARNQIEKE